ncbi:MAG: GDSL family lipase, partial [Selenomonadaceae bacterium]|nr:GDSL family lipase [Selenomonadaceae bacterium]
MKHIFIFIVTALMMMFFSVFTLFISEITDVLKLSQQDISVTFAQEGEDTVMTWTAPNYPCVYTIETSSPTTGIVRGAPEYH